MSYSALAFLIVAIIMFVSFVLASKINYKNRFKLDYHLRQHFPYELNYHGKYKDNIYGNLMYAIYAVAIILFLIFFSNGNFSNGYLIFSLIAGAITLVALTALIYVPIDHLRAHMLIVAFSFIFSMAFAFSIALAGYFKYKETNTVPAIVAIILGALITVAFLILIINPKLNHWAEMEEEIKEDGTKIMKRPKYFVLAYTEWAMMIIYQISLIALLIETI